MTPNDQSNSTAAPLVSASTPRPALLWRLGILYLICFGALVGLGTCYSSAPPTVVKSPFPPHLFVGWNKPDFVILLSGQQHGYLQPCGCSRPQLGGDERRYNLIQMMEKNGWPVVSVDLGDVPQLQGPAGLPNKQGLIKYRYAMEAMKIMNYTAVGLGEYEANLPLTDTLGAWALNEPVPPILAANLIDKAKVFTPGPEKDKILHNTAMHPVKSAGVTVGVGALLARTVREQKIKDDNFTFRDSADAVKDIKAELDGKADFRVLMLQGSLTRNVVKGKPAEAVALVQAYPNLFNVILCLSEEDPPPSRATMIGDSMAVVVGYKARHIGVVGVWKTGNPNKPFRMQYQLVALGEEFMTPPNEVKNNKVIDLMERYTEELKRGNYLARYPQAIHPHEIAVGGKTPAYVGSLTCKQCHKPSYATWLKTPHAHAYQDLANATLPSNRQYDPECIVCHTIGFGYKTGFRDAKLTPTLMNVGCESCHGPAGEHVAAQKLLRAGMPAPLAGQWRDLMDPWRTPDAPETPAAKNKRILRADAMCQQCHDHDNDVNWTGGAFERKWLKIWHYETRDEGFENRPKLIDEYKKKAAEAIKKEQDASKAKPGANSQVERRN